MVWIIGTIATVLGLLAVACAMLSSRLARWDDGVDR